MLQQKQNVDSSIPDTVAELKPMVESLHKELDNYQLENSLLREQISKLKQELYGRKSEKNVLSDDYEQQFLFSEPKESQESCEEDSVEVVTVPTHKRRKTGRKPLPPQLQRVEEYIDIAEDKKVCSCGCRKKKIGEERSEKLEMLPALFWVLRTVRPKYACPGCEGLESDGPTVTSAPLPAQILPKSIATPSLISHIFVSKFADALPFYRQEEQFARHGIKISRGSMCRWALKVGEKLEALLKFLHAALLSGPLIGIDETTVQVLKEPNRKASTNSYMWVFHGGPPGQRVVIYHYSTSRSGDVAQKFLGGYKGHVQTDGYVGYNFLDDTDGITHAGCWAHARRYFVKVLRFIQANKKQKPGLGKCGHAIEQIRRLYRIEKEAKEAGLSTADLHHLRQNESKPILDEFGRWLKENAPAIPPRSLLGEAFTYTINQWSRLIGYLKSGDIPIDNNITENAIRPFVVGRKNWLFSDQPGGAKAAALFYSLIETAKANGLNPYTYFLYLFDKLPLVKDEEDFMELLPIYQKQDALEQFKKEYWQKNKLPQ